MAIRAKNKDIDGITYVDVDGNIQIKRKITRVYKNNRLLWEFANSNFFTSDNCIIITADGYVFNGRKIE